MEPGFGDSRRDPKSKFLLFKYAHDQKQSDQAQDADAGRARESLNTLEQVACVPVSVAPAYRNVGRTSRAKHSIERMTRVCSRSPNQKLQLKCVMPTTSSTRLI